MECIRHVLLDDGIHSGGGGYGLAQVSLVVLVILLELDEVNTLVLGMQT